MAGCARIRSPTAGIRSDGRHSNYNGAAVTGVEKRAAAWLVELREKVVRLDLKVFGVQQPAVGPFQRRLQEIGSITPLVFGQYGELSASFEALIDTLAIKGCDQAADRYLLDVGPGAASVQKRLLRQHFFPDVVDAQKQARHAAALLGRLRAGKARNFLRAQKDEVQSSANKLLNAMAKRYHVSASEQAAPGSGLL